MPFIPTYVVFTDLIAIRIRNWNLTVCQQYLSIFFRNGRAYNFMESDGYTWRIEEDTGTITIFGWDPEQVQEVAQVAGQVIPPETLFFHASPIHWPTTTTSPIWLPSPPDEESADFDSLLGGVNLDNWDEWDFDNWDDWDFENTEQDGGGNADVVDDGVDIAIHLNK